jgi:hypothetical protein
MAIFYFVADPFLAAAEPAALAPTDPTLTFYCWTKFETQMCIYSWTEGVGINSRPTTYLAAMPENENDNSRLSEIVFEELLIFFTKQKW